MSPPPRVPSSRRWLKLVPVGNPALQLAAAAARYTQWGTFVANNSAKTWSCQIRVIDASGAVQDVAANADNSIGFELEAVQDGVAG